MSNVLFLCCNNYPPCVCLAGLTPLYDYDSTTLPLNVAGTTCTFMMATQFMHLFLLPSGRCSVDLMEIGFNVENLLSFLLKS